MTWPLYWILLLSVDGIVSDWMDWMNDSRFVVGFVWFDGIDVELMWIYGVDDTAAAAAVAAEDGDSAVAECDDADAAVHTAVVAVAVAAVVYGRP